MSDKQKVEPKPSSSPQGVSQQSRDSLHAPHWKQAAGNSPWWWYMGLEGEGPVSHQSPLGKLGLRLGSGRGPVAQRASCTAPVPRRRRQEGARTRLSAGPAGSAAAPPGREREGGPHPTRSRAPRPGAERRARPRHRGRRPAARLPGPRRSGAPRPPATPPRGPAAPPGPPRGRLPGAKAAVASRPVAEAGWGRDASARGPAPRPRPGSPAGHLSAASVSAPPPGLAPPRPAPPAPAPGASTIGGRRSLPRRARSPSAAAGSAEQRRSRGVSPRGSATPRSAALPAPRPAAAASRGREFRRLARPPLREKSAPGLLWRSAARPAPGGPGAAAAPGRRTRSPSRARRGRPELGDAASASAGPGRGPRASPARAGLPPPLPASSPAARHRPGPSTQPTSRELPAGNRFPSAAAPAAPAPRSLLRPPLGRRALPDWPFRLAPPAQVRRPREARALLLGVSRLLRLGRDMSAPARAFGARPKAGGGPALRTGESHAGAAPQPHLGHGLKRRILDPSGDYYYWWLSLMVAPIMYNWIILICRSCFPDLQQKYLFVWLALDYFCDLLYLLDIGVHFHTGFLEQGILIQDRAQISRRYSCSSAFLWDLVSVLPTDLLYLHLGVGTPAVRANRFLRSPRLFEAFDRIETRTAHPNSFRIAKLMLYVFITIHWNSCIYFALSRYIGCGADEWVYPNTSRPGFDRLQRQYLYSFYFSTLILTTVGDTPMPHREEEFLFMAVDFLLAVMGFATIMGSMTSVVSNMNQADAAFYPNYDLVKGYLHTHRVTRRIQHRVISWYQHLQMNKKMTNELEILQHLPERLRVEVAVSVHLPTLRKVQIFQNCEQSLLEELVLKLKPQVYSPGEYVCKKGDIGREMYFIREGQLAVVADDGVTQFAVLGEGLYFGEISIINIKGNKSGNRRTANIKSIGFSDLFCLSKEDLTEVLAEFPNAKAMLEAKGREILIKMDKLDLNAEASEIAQQQEEERRTAALEEALDGLQTKLARILAGLESSAFKMALRLEHLEWQTREWEGLGEEAQGAGP
ncbi:cyclic nucleotide-gated channel alpha-4 [Tiliqua scincoides]|uniref:cyclic nucleotide-gated channel alpha-4 n=1 Tax=Tiliqua scincoides TaxID=71010 RepID=UPI0034634023